MVQLVGVFVAYEEYLVELDCLPCRTALSD